MSGVIDVPASASADAGVRAVITKNKVSLHIPIRPRTLQRPRFSFRTGRAYTPKPTRRFLKRVRKYLQNTLKDLKPLDGELRVSFTFYFRGRRCGDLSNYVKAIEDACNKIVWWDDRQIKEYGRVVIVEGAEKEGIDVDVEVI